MRALLDVNVLIALLDADHSLHAPATQWFAANARDGWASCPITQNGCVRVMSNPAYPNPLPVSALIERLAEAAAHELHEFWPDDASLLDSTVVDPARIHGPRQLTDIYLLALAANRRGRLVTFDQGIPRDAAPKAQRKNLLVI
ncbi:MAG: TA system VapC family ribonuclease toxin [Usitatibacter sp.]